MIAKAVSWVFRLAIRGMTGARALQVELLPKGRQCVYFGNHSSHGDFVLIWSSLPPLQRGNVRPVAAADYWGKGRLRRYLVRSVFNAVLINRQREGRAVDPVHQLYDAIDGNASLILFPEGTRNTGDGLLPFKSGIYHLAQHKPELAFVPVWLNNLNRAMPKGRWLPLPLLCTATFGAAIYLREEETKDAFLMRCRDALLMLSAQEGAA